MTRLIKRYGSRKLYDTSESRYILLEDIADLVRKGESISVVDNKSGEDVTSQTLTQVISEEGRKKSNLLSSELLHDLIRAGESALGNSVRQFQGGVDRLMKKSIDRLVPFRNMRDEMQVLRDHLAELENAVAKADEQADTKPEALEPVVGSVDTKTDVPAEKAPRSRSRKTATKPAPKKTTTRKVASTKAADKSADTK